MPEDSSPELTIEDEIQKIIEPLKTLDAQLARNEAHVRNELEEILDKRKRLLAMLRQADPSMPGPGRKKTAVEPPKQSKDIGEGKVTQVLAAVAGLEGEWTSGVVIRLTEMERSSVNKALAVLRSRNQVRLIKMQRGPGDGSTYATTPRGAADGQQQLAVVANGSGS